MRYFSGFLEGATDHTRFRRLLARRRDGAEPDALRDWGGPELASLGSMVSGRLLRGSVLRARLGRADGLVLCDRNVTVLHGRHVFAGRDLNLEEGCEIMGLSRHGIVFGDRCTVGRFAMISPTNIFGGELARASEWATTRTSATLPSWAAPATSRSATECSWGRA